MAWKERQSRTLFNRSIDNVKTFIYTENRSHLLPIKEQRRRRFQESSIQMLIRYSEKSWQCRTMIFALRWPHQLTIWCTREFPFGDQSSVFMNLFALWSIASPSVLLGVVTILSQSSFLYDSWITFMVIISIVSLVKLLFIVWKTAFTSESANLRVAGSSRGSEKNIHTHKSINSKANDPKNA